MIKCIKALIIPEDLAVEARSALIHYLEDRRSCAIDFIKRNLFDAALSEIRFCSKLDSYLKEADVSFEFDDEEAPF